jgi:hypothetical protein
MNIFYLDTDPVRAAEAHYNKHVVKMILETAQLLCTTHHEFGNSNVPYKRTHTNHPSRIWVGQSADNYDWTVQLFMALCDEYTFRYGRTHASQNKIIAACYFQPLGQQYAGFTDPPQCMPDEFKNPDSTVEAYRAYYKVGKANLMDYKRREKPTWLG